MYFPAGSDKVSRYTDLVLIAESKQTVLLLWYHPVFQYPLCLCEALHEGVDKAVKLFSLMETKGKVKIREGVTYQLFMVRYQPVN